MVTDPNTILARWRNHFSQLLDILGFNDVRETEIHTTEPLVLEPSAFEFAIGKQKVTNHIDKIPAELIKAGGRTIR